MFFHKSNPYITPQELQRVIENLNAQYELVERQLKEGSISKKMGQEEMQRLSSLIISYKDNLTSTLEDQQTNYTPS